MHRLLRWYTFGIAVLAFGLLYSVCTYSIRHGIFVLKTDYEICQELTGRDAHVCDHIDWQYTDDFHLGKKVAACLKLAPTIGWPTEWCYPGGMDLRDGGWQPEHFPVAMPRPLAIPLAMPQPMPTPASD